MEGILIMKLKKFQELHQRKIGIVVGICFVVLLCAIIVVFRSFAFYEEQKEFDVIKGKVPDQNYDVMFSFLLEDTEGKKVNIETIPDGQDYDVTILCDKGATGVWDYEEWGPRIQNLTDTRTKCKINFGPLKPLFIDVIKSLPVVTSGDGLYEVSHGDADITYTNDETIIEQFKQTEFRYGGMAPNNYVEFNHELWRIIGLVNTPEGSRIKLIRNEGIGAYSWDSSDTSINNGGGVNEWSTSKTMHLFNYGAYYNRSSGTCYNGQGDATEACDFRNIGLTDEGKKMIDTVTWNLGSNDGVIYIDNNIHTVEFYNQERSKNVGHICNSGIYCNDTVTRTTTWVGQVGLMYPSDYGYATSGGSSTNRETCLHASLNNWFRSDLSDCRDNDWLYQKDMNCWTITSRAYDTYSSLVFSLDDVGHINSANANYSYELKPTIYLKTSVKKYGGNGMKDTPYQLIME